MSEDENKLQKARQILETLKTRIINLLWDDSNLDFNSEYLLIPWIREEAEYAIKELNLSADDEQYFIIKIDHIIGEYDEIL